MTYELQYKCFDRYLDGKICLSDFLVKESLLYGLSKNKILKIPHFIDTDFFIKDSVKSNSNNFTIGFCGAIYSLNGIYILIEAFKLAVKKNPNFRLLLIGTTHLREKDFFDEAIQEIKDHIIFPGMVSAKHVPDYLNKCDVLVNPREKSVLADSGFPTKIGEYLSTGKPVVTSQTGDLSDYFQDKEDIFFFESGDSKGLSDLLLFIYNNEKLAKRVAKNGLLSARKHLNYVESSKSLKNFLIN
jgi:glycosyltransferase involved in cell wall biosynthesis